MTVVVSGVDSVLNAHQEHHIKKLEDQNRKLREEIAGWKRLAVVCSVALEPMRMAGTTESFSPSLRIAVDNAVIGIRMALDGRLPPSGAYDDAVAHIRAIVGNDMRS